MIDTKLKRLFWAWHFWAGLVAGPVLLVMAITDGIYLFRSELENVWYSETISAEADLLTATGPTTPLLPALDKATARCSDRSDFDSLCRGTVRFGALRRRQRDRAVGIAAVVAGPS